MPTKPNDGTQWIATERVPDTTGCSPIDGTVV